MDDIALFVRAETQELIRRRKLLHFTINKEELKKESLARPPKVLVACGYCIRTLSLV